MNAPFNHRAHPLDALPARGATWDCAFCGRLRLCPYARPFPYGPLALESCRTCDDLFVEADDDRKEAIKAAIANHLI